MPDEDMHFETAIKMVTGLQQVLHDRRIEIDPSGQHAGVRECIIREMDDGITGLRMRLASLARTLLAQLIALGSLMTDEVQLLPALVNHLNECAYTNAPV